MTASDVRRCSAITLLKLISLTPKWRLHREQVMDALWPDADPEDVEAVAADLSSTDPRSVDATPAEAALALFGAGPMPQDGYARRRPSLASGWCPSRSALRWVGRWAQLAASSRRTTRPTCGWPERCSPAGTGPGSNHILLEDRAARPTFLEEVEAFLASPSPGG